MDSLLTCKSGQDAETPGPKWSPSPERSQCFNYALAHASEDEKLQQMWDQVNYVPEWVDWKQIERGQEVFYRYGLANLSAVCVC